jgi:integrase
VTDQEFRAVWEAAHFTVQDAMDLAYYTAQRPADVIRLSRADIREGELWITQGKTGQKVRVKIEGKLAEIVARIVGRQRKATGLSLIQDENGQPLTYTALRSRFDTARSAASVSFQFRDIRAKAASDLDNLAHAQKLLAHKRRTTTEHYAGRRKGEAVPPIRRELQKPLKS